MFSLSGQVALVTGSSRGIGKSIAEALIQQGAQVVLHGSNAQTLTETAQQIGAQHFIVANMAEADAADTIAAQLKEKGLKPSILVNNAGITQDGLFMRQSAEQWDAVLQVNLTATVRLTQALLPGMTTARFGRIINISSVVAHMGNVGQANYITSKAAITGFTKALAKEVARRNITVNCVAPGFIETAMTDALSDDVKTSYIQQIPAQRFGSAQEVAATVAFLCSTEAGYINGTTLHVNGGMYLP